MDVANIENNPWSVEDASAFLKYCCPECDFNDWNLQSFANHALENHKGSNILFTPENRDFPNVFSFGTLVCLPQRATWVPCHVELMSRAPRYSTPSQP